MKFVLSGITGVRNRGVEALVLSTVAGLRRHDPACEISFITSALEFDGLRDLGARALGDGFRHLYYNPGPRHRRIARRFFNVDPDHESFRAVREADAVIALGGDVFSSDYNGLDLHLAPLRYARRHGVSVVMLGHSVGPFKTEDERRLWCDEASQAALVTVRESASLRYVLNDCRLSPDRAKLTADPAFALALPDPACIDLHLSHAGIEPGAPFVAMAPSQGIVGFRNIDSATHLDVWVRLCRMAVQELGYPVLLIPHVQDDVGSNDDRMLCTQILRALDFDPEVRLIGGDFDATELKGLISRSNFFIAERMHAAIAGFSTCVPGLLVSYSVKAEGVTEDLFTPANRQRVLMPLSQFLDPATACRAATEIHRHRAEIARELEQKTPAIQSAAEDNFRLMFQTLARSK